MIQQTSRRMFSSSLETMQCSLAVFVSCVPPTMDAGSQLASQQALLYGVSSRSAKLQLFLYNIMTVGLVYVQYLRGNLRFLPLGFECDAP